MGRPVPQRQLQPCAAHPEPGARGRIHSHRIWGLRRYQHLNLLALPLQRWDGALGSERCNGAQMILHPRGDAGSVPTHKKLATSHTFRRCVCYFQFFLFSCQTKRCSTSLQLCCTSATSATLHLACNPPLVWGLSAISLLPPFLKSSPESICFSTAFSL